MSDLQCPVSVYVVGREANEEMAGMRIASVYAWAGSEVADVQTALDDLADQHRGESILLRVDDAQLAAIHRWAGDSNGQDTEALAPILLVGDSDGWVSKGLPASAQGA